MCALEQRTELKERIKKKKVTAEQTNRRRQVRETIARLRRFWTFGEQLSEEKDSYSEQVVDQQAAEHGVCDDLVRKARLLVDPAKGFSEAEFEKIIRLCKKHQAVLGVGLLVRLLSIPTHGDRWRLAKEAIRNRWTYRTLDDVIRARYGQRKKGGRRQRPPRDRPDLLAQLARLCETWTRWYRGVESRDARPEQPLPVSLKDLSDEVQDRIKRVTAAVEKLQVMVGIELSKADS